MNNKVLPLFTFVCGAAIGCFAGYYYANKNREETVFEFENEEEPEKKEKEIVLNPESFKQKAPIEDYASKYRKKNKKEKEIDSEDEYEPEEPISYRVINPNEFGNEADYDKIELECSDGKLFLNEDTVIDLNFDYMSHFGEYEEDSVYVADDKNKIYYSIIK